MKVPVVLPYLGSPSREGAFKALVGYYRKTFGTVIVAAPEGTEVYGAKHIVVAAGEPSYFKARALNTVCRKLRGWILCVDADTMVTPSMLPRNPDRNTVHQPLCGHWALTPEKSREVLESGRLEHAEIVADETGGRVRFPYFSGGCRLLHKKTWVKSGGWPEDAGRFEEDEFSKKLKKLGIPIDRPKALTQEKLGVHFHH